MTIDATQPNDKPTDDVVRYVAYGSNTSPARLRAYIDGSSPGSRFGGHPAASDRSETPVVDGQWMPGRLMFAGQSSRWGGGVAVVDLDDLSNQFFAVIYEMTRAQFEHIVWQETKSEVVVDWDQLAEHGRMVVGEGLYSLVAQPARGMGWLITCSEPPPPRPPTPEYRTIMRSGLLGWLEPDVVDSYLDSGVG